MDRAAIQYFKNMLDDSEMTRQELAKRAGIPYQTVRKWWENPKPPVLQLSDIEMLARGFGLTGLQAYKAIKALASTIEDPRE